MKKGSNEKDQVKIGYGKFSFEMNGDFVKENGKILAWGAVTCGVIVVSGITYGAVYAVTKNGEVAKQVAGNVVKLIPKSA